MLKRSQNKILLQYQVHYELLHLLISFYYMKLLVGLVHYWYFSNLHLSMDADHSENHPIYNYKWCNSHHYLEQLVYLLFMLSFKIDWHCGMRPDQNRVKSAHCHGAGRRWRCQGEMGRNLLLLNNEIIKQWHNTTSIK